MKTKEDLLLDYLIIMSEIQTTRDGNTLGILRDNLEKARKEIFSRMYDWKSVKEELPSEKLEIKNCIVKYKYGVGEAVFMKGTFRRTSDWNDEIPEVTYWTTLPEFKE